MPRTRGEVETLLDRLAERCGDELEDQDLDFKEWDRSSMRRSVVDMAVCMANGGGGTVVFGVADEEIGRERAVLGVPPEVDVNRLKLAVYDSTDPKLTPVFEELHVPEGTGRLVLTHVHPGIPPYTDTGGRGTVRVGSDCKQAIRGGAMRGEPPLANAAIRRITRLDRQQVNRLIHELAEEGRVRIDGHGRGARYVFTGSPDPGE